MKASLILTAMAAALIGFPVAAFAVEPTNINELEPIKRGAYTFYPPYLDGGIKSMDVIPPPPEPGSAAHDADRQAALKEYPAARMAQATQDARISPTYYAKIYGAVLGEDINAQRTPAIYALIARSIADYGLSTSDAKKHYNRTRPFAEFGLPSCTPYAEDYLREDGSYPSGHTATGYGLSLVVASVAPERQQQLIERGKDYAQSRIVCNVHYPSDVKAGMQVAEAVLRSQMENEQFQVDLKAAQSEWKALKK